MHMTIKCDACGATIRAGERYFREALTTGVAGDPEGWEGRLMGTRRICARCAPGPARREAHKRELRHMDGRLVYETP